MVGREGSTTTFSLGALFDCFCFLGFGSSTTYKEDFLDFLFLATLRGAPTIISGIKLRLMMTLVS